MRLTGFLSFLMLICLQSLAQEMKIMDSLTLQEVEVFGKRVSVYPIDLISLKSHELEPIRDLGTFLRQEPNVSGIRKGGIAVDPVIRGFKYSQVTVLLNEGIKIEGGCPNRMDPVASHVENEELIAVEVVKGPYALKYGPIMGAMINLRTIRPILTEKPAIHGKILYGYESNWNGHRAHLELSGGSRSICFRASGGYKGYGDYTAGNGEQFNTSFKKMYGSASAGIRLHEKHSLLLSYAYNQGKDVSYPALPMDEQTDVSHIGSVLYEASEIARNWENFSAMAYFTSVHHVMDNYDRPAAQTMEAVTTVDSWDAGGKATGTFRAGKHQFVAGIDFEHIFKDGTKVMTMEMVMGTDTFTTVKKANVFNQATWDNLGVFCEYQTHFREFSFTSALRIDLNQANSSDTFRLIKNGISWFDDTQSRFLNVSLSAGMKKKLARNLFLTASLGMGTRSPSLLERFIKLMPVQFDSYDYLGNPQLKPEKNCQADLSLDYSISGAGSVALGGFFSLVADYILGKIVPPSVIQPSTQGAKGVKQYSNADWVYLTGFELSYRSPAERLWRVTATVAATYGTNPEAVKYIIEGGQVTGEETVKYDPLPEIPPLEGTVTISYGFFRKMLTPQVTVRMVNAQKRISEAYGEETTPGFITASAALNFSPVRYFSITAGADNIFDKPYYEHLNRRIVGSTERFFEPGRVFYVNLILQF